MFIFLFLAALLWISTTAYEVSLSRFQLREPPVSLARRLFSSVPRRPWLLKHVDLTIGSKTVLPIIGNSGSGKTLLAEAFYVGLGGAGRDTAGLFDDVAISIVPAGVTLTPVWIDRFSLKLGGSSDLAVSLMYLERIKELIAGSLGDSRVDDNKYSSDNKIFLCFDEAVDAESREVREAVRLQVENLCRENDWVALWITHRREDISSRVAVEMVGGRLTYIDK
ncbi:hypothetical protein TrVE_jg404 [Triparma verrucosa]|uniref:AAA+ ATPase domain-containing protein n=1 Tax=Triparma verrucosa TaxID=1606542 RepID=A0A9W7F988_9STRA|nr:hypothetical protein TrVE_jg404 [Triparma verrucosa]